MEENLKNPIEEYFNENNQGNKNFIELFEGDKNIDLKSDLTLNEVIIFNKLVSISSVIKTFAETKLYQDFLESFLRLKVSLDRKSRNEFVDVNRTDRFKQNLNDFGNFSQITKIKEN